MEERIIKCMQRYIFAFFVLWTQTHNSDIRHERKKDKNKNKNSFLCYVFLLLPQLQSNTVAEQ